MKWRTIANQPRGDRTSGRIYLSVSHPQRSLLILLAALQVADVLTTNRALAAPENWELNPIMAYTMAHWGAAWWLPKVALVGYAMAAMPFIRRRWPLMVAVGFYVAIVANNSLYL